MLKGFAQNLFQLIRKHLKKVRYYIPPPPPAHTHTHTHAHTHLYANHILILGRKWDTPFALMKIS